MVHRIVRFRCDECRKRYSSYDEAYGCEIGHITDTAISNAKEAISRAFRTHLESPKP